MSGQTNERAFEGHVEQLLLQRGWHGTNAEWDVERVFFPARVCHFLEASQPKVWADMRGLHAADSEFQDAAFPILAREVMLSVTQVRLDYGRRERNARFLGRGLTWLHIVMIGSPQLRTRRSEVDLELARSLKTDGGGVQPPHRRPHGWVEGGGVVHDGARQTVSTMSPRLGSMPGDS